MLTRLLERLADVIVQRPRAVLAWGLLPSVILGYLAATVPLDLSFAAIAPGDDPRIVRFFAAIDNFGSASQLVLAVEGGSAEERQAFLADVVPGLEALELVGDVVTRVDDTFFRQHALLAVEAPRLEGLATLLRDHPEAVRPLWTEPGALGLLHTWEGLLRYGEGADPTADEATTTRLMSAWAHLMALYHHALTHEVEEAVLDAALTDVLTGRAPRFDRRQDPNGHLVSPDGGMMLARLHLTVDPIHLPIGVDAMGAAQQVLAEALTRHPNVQAGFGGLAAVSHEDQTYVLSQVQALSPVSLILMMLLFLWVDRSLRAPLLVGAALALSVAWTFGLVHLVLGVVTATSAIFGILLFGLGVDYAIHYVVRLREELGDGHGPSLAARRSLRLSGPSILAGGATTALAFFSMLGFGMTSTDHLGITTGLGIVCCMGVMMTLLPAALLVWGKPRGVTRRVYEVVWMARWVRLVVHHPGGVLVVAAAAVVLSALYIPTLRFETDLEKIYTQGMVSTRVGQEIRARFDLASDFAMVAAPDLESARRLAAALAELPTVARVEGLHELLPPDQAARVAPAREIGARVGAARAAAGPRGEASAARVAEALGWQHDAAANLGGLLEMQGLSAATPALRARDLAEASRLALDTPEGPARLGTLDRWLTRRLDERLDDLAAHAQVEALTVADLPRTVTEGLVGKDGQLLLRVFPRVNIVSVEGARAFQADLVRVDPGATGIQEMAEVLITSGMDRLPLVTALLLMVIGLLLVATFRDLWMVTYAMVPLAVGALVALGLCLASGVTVNVLMAASFPLILGIGIDDGIHVVDRWRELRREGLPQREAVYEASHKTGRAILLTTLTTMVGFGVLVAINHPGIQAMALMVTVGVGMCLVTSVSVLPALILVGERVRERRLGPRDWR